MRINRLIADTNAIFIFKYLQHSIFCSTFAKYILNIFL